MPAPNAMCGFGARSGRRAPDSSNTAGSWRRGFDFEALEATVVKRHRTPIAAPVTAIYSRADGIVAWRACIDPWTPVLEHVEFASTHLRPGFDPESTASLHSVSRGRAPQRACQAHRSNASVA